MSKKENSKVLPSIELLSEMECLEIHGGSNGNQAGTDAVYVFCHNAKCSSECTGTSQPKFSGCDVYVYCETASCH